MRARFLWTALSLLIGLGVASQAGAATITASPNTGDGTVTSVTISMDFVGGESAAAVQLKLNLVDSAGNADDGTGVFTVTITAGTNPAQFPIASSNLNPASGGNPANAFSAGTAFAPVVGPANAQVVILALAATGATGTLNLVIDTLQTFWTTPAFANVHDFSGTIATFTVGGGAPIPEPGSLLLMGAGLAVIGLVARKTWS